MPSPTDDILYCAAIDGELRAGEHAATLRGSLRLRRDGAVDLDFEPAELSQDNVWLLKACSSTDKTLPRLSVRGGTTDGVKIESDHVFVVSHRVSRDAAGTTISVRADALAVRISYLPLPATSVGMIATYATVGMRSFMCPSASSPTGRVTLSAPAEIDEPGSISGRLHIEAPADERPLEEWLVECDRLAERVLDMISLAEGMLIRWPVRRIEGNAGLIALECKGKQGASEAQDGLFHHQHLGPVLDLALHRYTDELCERTGLAVALEWFVHHPHYSELQLIAAMTALEHLVDVFVRRNGAPEIMDGKIFDGLLEAMRAIWTPTLRTASTEDRKKIERVKNNLGSLNRGSFRDKLEAMLVAYGVPCAGLAWPVISAAVDARNRVVHRGLYKSAKDQIHIQDHVAVLRELLKRIFLSLLQYEGEYFSLLNGPAWVSFPPDTQAI